MTGRPDIRDALTILAGSFRIDATDALYTAAILALDDIAPDALKIAVKRAITECKFMPSFAELRELAGVPKPPSPDDEAAIVWGQVRQAIRTIGGYGNPPDFGPAGNAALSSIGDWWSVTGMEKRELDMAAKRFIEAYAAHRRNGTEGLDSVRLLGYHDAHNKGITSNGGGTAPIGDALKGLLE